MLKSIFILALSSATAFAWPEPPPGVSPEAAKRFAEQMNSIAKRTSEFVNTGGGYDDPEVIQAYGTAVETLIKGGMSPADAQDFAFKSAAANPDIAQSCMKKEDRSKTMAEPKTESPSQATSTSASDSIAPSSNSSTEGTAAGTGDKPGEPCPGGEETLKAMSEAGRNVVARNDAEPYKKEGVGPLDKDGLGNLTKTTGEIEVTQEKNTVPISLEPDIRVETSASTPSSEIAAPTAPPAPPVLGAQDPKSPSSDGIVLNENESGELPKEPVAKKDIGSHGGHGGADTGGGDSFLPGGHQQQMWGPPAAPIAAAANRSEVAPEIAAPAPAPSVTAPEENVRIIREVIQERVVQKEIDPVVAESLIKRITPIIEREPDLGVALQKATEEVHALQRAAANGPGVANAPTGGGVPGLAGSAVFNAARSAAAPSEISGPKAIAGTAGVQSDEASSQAAASTPSTLSGVAQYKLVTPAAAKSELVAALQKESGITAPEKAAKEEAMKKAMEVALAPTGALASAGMLMKMPNRSEGGALPTLIKGGIAFSAKQSGSKSAIGRFIDKVTRVFKPASLGGAALRGIASTDDGSEEVSLVQASLGSLESDTGPGGARSQNIAWLLFLMAFSGTLVVFAAWHKWKRS